MVGRAGLLVLWTRPLGQRYRVAISLRSARTFYGSHPYDLIP